MSFWLTDPELFLYAKGIDPDDVHLWRCNKPVTSSSSSSSSLVVPMKSDDFDYVSKVENHLELIGEMFDWDEPDYKRLVKYIYEKHLLINSQGFVIVKVLHEADTDGNKKIDDADEEEEDVPGIYYIRSLDVLPLKPYIPKLRERPIPLRTVKYLGDLNGRAAMMESDSLVTKLTTRVENLEAGSIRLESKNNTLDTSVTKLTTGLATTAGNVADLESKNKTLDTNVTKLTTGLATTTGNVADLQSKYKALEAKNKTLDSNVKTLEGKVTKLTDKVDDLESKNKTLEYKVGKLTADLVTQMNALTTLQQQVKNINENPNFKEAWMNNLTNSNWVGIERLRGPETFDNFVIVGGMGTFKEDDTSTNVRARYWFKMNAYPGTSIEYKAISLEDLTPNKERAGFSYQNWYSFQSKGKLYVYRVMH